MKKHIFSICLAFTALSATAFFACQKDKPAPQPATEDVTQEVTLDRTVGGTYTLSWQLAPGQTGHISMYCEIGTVDTLTGTYTTVAGPVEWIAKTSGTMQPYTFQDNPNDNLVVVGRFKGRRSGTGPKYVNVKFDTPCSQGSQGMQIFANAAQTASWASIPWNTMRCF